MGASLPVNFISSRVGMYNPEQEVAANILIINTIYHHKVCAPTSQIGTYLQKYLKTIGLEKQVQLSLLSILTFCFYQLHLLLADCISSCSQTWVLFLMSVSSPQMYCPCSSGNVYTPTLVSGRVPHFQGLAETQLHKSFTE